MKIRASQIAIGVVCLIMAFAVTLQIKSVRRIALTNVEDLQRVSTLQAELKKEKEKSEELYKSVIQYKDELETFRSEASKSSDVSQALSKQLTRTELLAGLSTVEGPGVSVTLKESANAAQNSVNPNDEIIHDGDILLLINELKAAGAEAIALNGERIVNTSEIRCVGPVVSVNGNRYGTPFEITAIGDSATLDSALNFAEGPVELMRLYNIEVTIKKVNKLKIEGFKGTTNFKYAVPAQKEGQ